MGEKMRTIDILLQNLRKYYAVDSLRALAKKFDFFWRHVSKLVFWKSIS